MDPTPALTNPTPTSDAVQEAEKRLAAAAPRRKVVDLMLVAVTIGLWVAATWAIYEVAIAPSGLSVIHQFAFTCFVAGTVGYLLFLSVRGPAAWILREFAADWVLVDDEDGVVKVVGSIPMEDWDCATARLMTLRPNLVQVWNARELYGVPLAARPSVVV